MKIEKKIKNYFIGLISGILAIFIMMFQDNFKTLVIIGVSLIIFHIYASREDPDEEK